MKRALFACAAILSLCAFAAGADVIIESRREGQNFDHYKELEGSWIDSNQPVTTAKSAAPGLTPAVTCGARAVTSLAKPAVARFSPKFDKPGHYYVFVTYPKAANAAPVTYVIKHEKGQATKAISQNGWGPGADAAAGTWVFLGDYDFAAGDDQFVELNTKGTELKPAIPEQLPRLYADAVKFSTDAPPAGTVAASAAPAAVSTAATTQAATQGAAVAVAQATSGDGADIVVESRAEGKNFANYKETEGGWVNSGNAQGQGKSKAPDLSPAAQVGSRKLALGQQGSARFTPNLAKAAKLNVYVTWPREANSDTVVYTVKHSGGEEKKTLQQDGWGKSGNSNANLWVNLGQFQFEPGPDQYVEVRVPAEAKPMDDQNLKQAYADAARFTSSPIKDEGSASFPAPAGGGAAGAKTASKPATKSGGRVEWSTDINALRSQAAQSNKKILLFFFAPGSEVSSLCENEVLAAPEVKSILADGFVCGRVNFIENTQFAYGLKVFKAGTIMVYDSQGQALKKLDGRQKASEVAEILKGL